jgi:hypothetical protein
LTALLGFGAAVGAGAFTVGLGVSSTPPEATTTVTSSGTTPLPTPPTALTRFISEDGEDGGWHRLGHGIAGIVQQAPTAGTATTSGGSTATSVP